MEETYKYKDEKVCYEDAHKSTTNGNESLSVNETQTKIHHSKLSLNGAETKSLNPKSIKVECEKSVDAKPKIQRMPLLKLWLVLMLTLVFALILLTASHLTHSLTLRVEAYHSLYNLMALTGCLITIKVCERPASIKNTFGWARIELLSCLCSLLFVASFCFSIALESVQTAAHAGHQDPMHHPLPVIGLGVIGLVLNIVVYCLIGGYTHHQGCFLEKRSSGVYVQSRICEEAVQSGMRALISNPCKSDSDNGDLGRSHEGVRGLVRDMCGLVIVIICASIVLWDTRATLALYIDPAFAMLSASILLYLSYPYGKECCQILLQTIPGNIDVQTLSEKLLQEFPEIVNVHHLHIWSLTPGKAIATAHVVYSSPKVYRRSAEALEQFFMDKEITQVTLQPEFVHYASTNPSEVGSNECLLRCANDLCRQKECCDDFEKEEMEDIELQKITVVERDEKKTQWESIEKMPSTSQFSSTQEITMKDQSRKISQRRFSLDLGSKLPLEKMSFRRTRSKEDIKNIQNKIRRSSSCNLKITGQNQSSL